MSFEKMMAELKLEYINTLPQKILEIKAHLTANDLDLMRDDFHKLKGTGKTYGLPEITELGFVVETICLQKKDSACEAVAVGKDLLQEIFDARTKNLPFEIKNDARFQALQKLVAIP